MKRISWLLIVVFFLSVVLPAVNLPGNPAMAADTLRVAKITAVQGDVKVLRAGGEKTFPAFKGMGLTQGDTIITGKDGRVTLELAEDKELKVGENSRVMISELVQSSENNADKTSLNLKAGQVYTNVKSQLSAGAKYEIRTPTAVMGVRGTQFFVTLASGGQAAVVTLEGRVFVTVPQLVTLEDGTTVTQDVEIEVQANQIFVQTGDITDPGRYDLETLTEDVELSLFVLETLQEISMQQPELINPEILQNLEERIEQARQEQQQQQEQQERLQQELAQNIQYDSSSGSESSSSSDSGSGSVSPPPTDPGDDDNEDLPEIVITTQLENIYLQVGGEESYPIETEPADVVLEVEVEDESIAEAHFEGKDLIIYGVEPGITTVTVTASKEGYLPAEISFTVIVYEEYEEGDWDRTIIDEYGVYTDIALDSKGMPHIIYDAGSVRYRYWNGNSWQEEEPQFGSSQGSLTILHDSYGNEYSLFSYNDGGKLGYDVFDGRNWHHLSFGYEGMSVGASSTNTTPYYNYSWDQIRYGAGVSYYDEINGDLYFRFNPYPENNNSFDWSAPFLVAGEYSDAGKSSSLAFGYDFGDKDVEAYIAYYDESNGGSLKLAVISDPLNPNLEDIDIIEIDDQLGYDQEGQYVSLAVDDGLNVLHLAYYDAVNKELRYATWFDGELNFETVDSEGDAGKYASLALDKEGNPHIGYYAEDGSVGELRYAHRSNPEEEWLREVIDQGAGVGLYTSIAWDIELEAPHFAYTARIGDYWVVKHATKQGVMNSVEPGELSGTREEFEDATFYISNFGNGVRDVWREVGVEIDYLVQGEDYILTEGDEGLILTLKSDFLNTLPVTYEYEDPHRIWILFDYGLPVFINVWVTESFEAYISRDNPDLAYDPINNRYLVVYERDIIEYIDSEIWGRFISADGVLSPEFLISNDKRCFDPKVVYNPENDTFLVTWQYEEEYLIFAQILDEEGNPYEEKGNFAVCPETVNGQYSPAVAVNTDTGDYLIAWDEQVYEGNLEREIYGQLLDKEGNNQDVGRLDLVSMEESQSDPILAYSANRYLLVFGNTPDYYDYDIKGRMFNSEGELVEEIEIAVGDADQYVHALAVDDTNERFLVVWQEYRNDETGNIFGRFINIDGTMEDDFPVYQSEQDQYAPSVAFNADGGFLVAWQDGQDRLFARYFTAEGEGIGAPVPIDPEGEELRNVKVVYNPEENNYLAVYVDYSSYPTKIRCKILQAAP
ncbi:MAG: hypothetical protein GXW85_08450 [Clostridia bacterium]|nr:hypothetical protein [Clostridia bacterium]